MDKFDVVAAIIIKNDKYFKLNHITRHMLGLYAGLPGGKIFRQMLNEISINNNQPKAILDLSEKNFSLKLAISLSRLGMLPFFGEIAFSFIQ